MNREQFEREFHSRTLAYQPDYKADQRPIVIWLGDDARTPNGHLLVAALINQLARAHQHIVVPQADNTLLLCPQLFGLATLHDATLGLGALINPLITATTEIPAGPPLVTIGIGSISSPVDLRVGCDGWLATFGATAEIDRSPTGRLGAMLASCITATYVFHALLGHPTPLGRSYSLWEYGRESGRQGPAFDGALDVGTVLQVGAGGVGGSLDYWLALIGLYGRWTITDSDTVEVSNLNRQLPYLAQDAGFPDRAPVKKAAAVAALLNDAATADVALYGDTPEVSAGRYDLVLPLANEHGVRSLLQARQPPVMLHATTGPNGRAQLHRHIAGCDDCINCRLPEDAPSLACAADTVATDADTGASTDAALPFLSAAAALLLLTALIRLQIGRLHETNINFVALTLDGAAPTLQEIHQPCQDGCTRWAPAEVRRNIPAGDQFSALDPARARQRSR